MNSFLHNISETPIWVWGIIGATAFGYRTLRSMTKPENLNLAALCIDTFAGYMMCSMVPLLTPVIVIGIGYEDYCKRNTTKD